MEYKKWTISGSFGLWTLCGHQVAIISGKSFTHIYVHCLLVTTYICNLVCVLLILPDIGLYSIFDAVQLRALIAWVENLTAPNSLFIKKFKSAYT